jgi:hypothetical protein
MVTRDGALAKARSPGRSGGSCAFSLIHRMKTCAALLKSVRSDASILLEAQKKREQSLGESEFAFKPSNAQSSMGRLAEVMMRIVAMVIAALLTLAFAASERDEIDGVDRAERLGRVGNPLDQLFFADGACRRCVANAGRLRRIGRPPFLAEQRNKSHIREVFAAIFTLRNPSHPHQFLDVRVRTHRDDQPAADFQLAF